jgi:integrase
MAYLWLDTRVDPPIYRFNYLDARGRKCSGTGTTKEKETRDMAALVEAKYRAIRKGWADAPKSFKQARARSFSDVTKEYLSWGAAQGGRGGRSWSKEHLRIRTYWLEWWQTSLGLLTLADLDDVLPRAEKELRKLLTNGKAGKTVQNCAESLRAFGRWCKSRGFLPGDPLEGMAGFDVTPKSTRRALTAEELNRLLDYCAPHRRLLYEVACTTGLRRGELRSLRIEHLDVKNCGLLLDAAWTKSRKQGFQPLPEFVVKRLADAAKQGLAAKQYERIAKERESRDLPPEFRTSGNVRISI